MIYPIRNSVINTLSGISKSTLTNCQYLSDYSTLVGKIKEGIRLGLSSRDAISRAVKFCLEHCIMGEYLVEHAEEVFNMLALEWNMDDALTARFEEGYEDGREEEREAIAINMIRSGMLAENIHEFTKLSLERIKELEKSVRS